MVGSPLQPGRSRVDRFLLNFKHEINAPGDYWVDVKRGGPGAAHSKLHFQVDSNLVFPSGRLQMWVDQLESSDREMRLEAARTLASLGPQSGESVLLNFSNDPELRKYAPLAFHRLGTARSLEALADLMKASGPGTFERLEAARYLAKTNDQKWYPLLLDAAEKNAVMSEYPAYAAELGGDKMLPELVRVAKNPQSRLQAVMAMGSTGSKEAIPILLELLKNPDTGVRNRADYSLSLLTHRKSPPDTKTSDTGVEYMEWKKWWASEGATAPIYRDGECGEMVPPP
jgi:HEAT repeat protein